MKIFVFLYPYHGYFESTNDDLSFSFMFGHLTNTDLYGIQEVIESRYRAQGYHVVWAFFGRKRALHLPVLRSLSPYVVFEQEDLIISTGTQSKHVNSEFILNQLPEGIDKLVIGGFHWQYCCSELAGYAHSLGIDCVVDEDTTQTYWAKLAMFRTRTTKQMVFPLRPMPFVPLMVNSIESAQVRLYRKLEQAPWLAREWDQETYTLQVMGKTGTISRERFHEIFD